MNVEVNKLCGKDTTLSVTQNSGQEHSSMHLISCNHAKKNMQENKHSSLPLRNKTKIMISSLGIGRTVNRHN